jgi:hypothetical protein
MLVRYLPGRFDERIPVPVQKKIVSHGREEGNSGSLSLRPPTVQDRRSVSIIAPSHVETEEDDNVAENGGLIVLLIAFCAGGYGIASKRCRTVPGV